jgi:hypothetical protein
MVRFTVSVIDLTDSSRAYGKYTSFFQPPPMPKCRPPPRHEMLPCPHHARHLIVSAATASSTFGGAFNDYFEDPRKMEVYRQRPIFDLARAGYEALFHLSDADAHYVSSRIETFQNRTMLPEPSSESGMIIGLHVRRGDCHPYEFQYRDSYVPLDRFAQKARDVIQETFNQSSSNSDENKQAEAHSLMLVASDDPDVYESEEFSQWDRAQDIVALASHPGPSASPSNSPIRKFVEEAVGWEGGFFAGMFWSLGRASSTPPTALQPSETNLEPTEEALRLRELVGRAYLLDLAVLGGASDRVICTVSSMGFLSGGVLRGDTDRSGSLWFDNRVTHLSWEALGIGIIAFAYPGGRRSVLRKIKRI